MDLLVAVDAASVDDKPASGPRIVWARWVSGLDVALLTEARNPDLQEPRIGGAVRLVAVRTALRDRRMFPEKRPPLLGMALEAVVIDRILPKHRLGGGPMRVVAVGATHLSLAQRHVGAALELGAAGLVALRADLDRGRLRQIVSVRHRLHHLVTGDAGYSPYFVGAPLPEGMLTLFVTAIHTRGILQLDRLCPLLERDQCLYGAALCIHVRAPWTMARLTVPPLLGSTRVHRHDAPHFSFVEALVRFPMAPLAGLPSHVLGAWGRTDPLWHRRVEVPGGCGLGLKTFRSGRRRVKSTAGPPNKESNSQQDE